MGNYVSNDVEKCKQQISVIISGGVAVLHFLVKRIQKKTAQSIMDLGSLFELLIHK